MKKIIVYACATLLLSAAACDKKDKTAINPIPVDYKSWYKPLKKPLTYQIPGHGKSRRIVFLNDKAQKAQLKKDENDKTIVDFPDGSIVIKEVYKREGAGYQIAPQIVAMVKDRKNEKAQEGWLYYVRNPGSPQIMLMKGRFCIGCHEAANEAHPYFDKNMQGIFRDYIFLNVVGKE